MTGERVSAAQVAADLAVASCGVVGRVQLRERGVERHHVRTLVRRDAVVALGTQALHVRRAGWHEVKSLIAAEVINSGAGAWADGVSALLVQQRLTTPGRLSAALQMHPTLRRRRVIAGFIREIGGGSQSIDELAFVAHLCRRRLPLPDRQVVRQGPDRRWYFDARWNAAFLVAEIDGAHHQGGANPITDAGVVEVRAP